MRCPLFPGADRVSNFPGQPDAISALPCLSAGRAGSRRATKHIRPDLSSGRIGPVVTFHQLRADTCDTDGPVPGDSVNFTVFAVGNMPLRFRPLNATRVCHRNLRFTD